MFRSIPISGNVNVKGKVGIVIVGKGIEIIKLGTSIFKSIPISGNVKVKGKVGISILGKGIEIIIDGISKLHKVIIK
jgi:hypothetical protein